MYSFFYSEQPQHFEDIDFDDEELVEERHRQYEAERMHPCGLPRYQPTPEEMEAWAPGPDEEPF